ncbi:hypothetical protein D9M71_459490 [compost metagenome]
MSAPISMPCTSWSKPRLSPLSTSKVLPMPRAQTPPLSSPMRSSPRRLTSAFISAFHSVAVAAWLPSAALAPAERVSGRGSRRVPPLSGLTGLTGFTGSTGLIGSTGVTGSMGFTGSTGSIGTRAVLRRNQSLPCCSRL